MPSSARTAPGPDLSALGDEMYAHWEKAMTGWWDQVLDSPSVIDGMGKGLGAAARARGQYRQRVDESLERLHLPSRGDVTRIAGLVGQLEERLLQQEDRWLETGDQLPELRERMAALEREVVRARIEAAEARLELREALSALREQVSGLRAESASATTSSEPSTVSEPSVSAPSARPSSRKKGRA